MRGCQRCMLPHYRHVGIRPQAPVAERYVRSRLQWRARCARSTDHQTIAGRRADCACCLTPLEHFNTRGPMATLQLYAIWTVLSIGAAGALLAWWIM